MPWSFEMVESLIEEYPGNTKADTIINNNGDLAGHLLDYPVDEVTPAATAATSEAAAIDTLVRAIGPQSPHRPILNVNAFCERMKSIEIKSAIGVCGRSRSSS